MWIRIIIDHHMIFKVLLSMSTGHPQRWDDFKANNKVGVSSLKNTSWFGLPAIHMSTRALFIWSTFKAHKYLPRNCSGLTGITQASNWPHWMGWCYPQHCPDSNLWDGSTQVQHRRRRIELLEINLPAHYIAMLLGVSASTVNRWMREFDLSARQFYSNLTDQELDETVQQIKTEMPAAGYRMVKGRLKSLGIHVQWWRVAASMHGVDSLGILSRLTGMGCIVRRTYSVRGPLSLWHCDTNHKLIRFVLLKRLFNLWEFLYYLQHFVAHVRKMLGSP